MNAFVRTKILHFEDGDIEVRELTAAQLVAMSTQEDFGEVQMIALATNLCGEEIEKLAVNAVRLISDAFRELNSNLFESGEAESGEPKK